MSSQYLDLTGTNYLTTKIVNYIRENILQKIKPTITEDGTVYEIASVKAVWDALAEVYDKMSKIEVSPVDPGTGEPITIDPGTGKPGVNDPIEGVIYLVKDSEGNFEQWVMFNNEWYNIGTTEVELSGYWKIADLTALTITEIDDMWDAIFA